MRHVNKPEFVAKMRALKPDLIVTMHFPVIFKKPLLELPPLGCVNIHPTRLPYGQGKTPACWHMLMGDDKGWITLHFLDEGVDTGDVIAQGYVDITSEDTGHTMSERLFPEGRRIFAEALPLLREGKAPRTPQDQIKGVKLLIYNWEPHFARIPWEQPAAKVAHHVRALSRPKTFPTYSGEAITTLAGRRVSVWQASVAEDGHRAGSKADPGEILALAGEGIMVKTGEGAVVLSDVDVEEATPGLPGVFELLESGLPAMFG
jgi:methionyl-tRNA formyltransferase